ncbi:XdhC family protein [Streptomyces sp. NPDC004270]
MLELAEDLRRWCTQGRDFAVASVVAVTGSAPALPGSSLVVDSLGAVVGSVSTTCVEASVYDLCRQSLVEGATLRADFSSVPGDPFAVAPLCGGTVEVLVTPMPASSPGRQVLRTALEEAVHGKAVALVQELAGASSPSYDAGLLLVRADGSHLGELAGGGPRTGALVRAAVERLAAGRPGSVTAGSDGTAGPSAFADVRQARPRLIVFGSGAPAPALVRAGALLGYHTTVCDARPVFTTHERFPEADEVVVDWPHRYLASTTVDERTVLCLLTHDSKVETPLLQLALRLPVAYVGAMGSRSTHAERLRLLRESGASDASLAVLRGPIGLDLGGRTAEETALSVMAEIVAVRHGGSGAPLSHGRGAIHRPAPERAPDLADWNDSLPRAAS